MHIRACSTNDGVGRRNEGFFACLWVAGARDVGLWIWVGLEGAVGRRGSWGECLRVEFRDGIVADFDSGGVLVMLLVGAVLKKRSV